LQNRGRYGSQRVQLNAGRVDVISRKVRVSVGRIPGRIEGDRTGIRGRRNPVELKARAILCAVARASGRVLNKGDVGCARLRTGIFANHLSEIVDGRQFARLRVLKIAVEPRGKFEAPALLSNVGYSHRHSLFDAGNIDRAALQCDRHASGTRIEVGSGMT